MPHAIMGQCIYPFEALDDDYGSKLHSVSQSTERAGELRNVSIHGQGGKAAACKSGRAGGGQGPFLHHFSRKSVIRLFLSHLYEASLHHAAAIWLYNK